MNNISKSLSKAPSVLTAIACIVSFAMLVTLLLFQGGILYSMGLTMLTSDILVTAITIVLAVCAILSLAAMIRSMVANKKNKKLIHNIIADVEGSKEAEKTATPAPVQVQEEAKKEHVEQACAPVEEEPVKEEPVKEPVEEPVPAKEAVEETPAHEEEQPAVELTKFENSMVMLMKRGNVPENVYAIEEYKEGAVCLTHDKEHYFVYICKDNDADDVEYFPIHDEKAVAMAFATRIRNKMNDKKPA